MFFSFDGLDGVGKTTQLRLFCQWLDAHGRTPVVCRDPGSTPLGERVREILLTSGEETPIAPRTEMLLYMAARAQLVDEVIRPALAAGQTVVSDRFLLANIVYQGHAGGLDVASVRTVGQVATAGVAPDCTFLLDMDPSTAHARIDRELDRMERRGDEFRRQLRDGFLAEAKQMGASVHVVDASRAIDAVHDEILAIAQQALSGPG
ncbi:MAG: dTMP kinase [Planctomycetales bacterium]|nr:dTMP kinase [Planctomycetales bacterium]